MTQPEFHFSAQTPEFSQPIFCNQLCSNDRCLSSTHQEMFKDYDRKRDVRVVPTARFSSPRCSHSTNPIAQSLFSLTSAQVDDVRRFGDKGTFFTGYDILDHGHRRKPQTFDG
jgi:hypothetical protein